jgi:hypothetical protein
MNVSFQPGALGSACLKPKNASATASFYHLKRSFFSTPGVKLIQSGEQRTGLFLVVHLKFQASSKVMLAIEVARLSPPCSLSYRYAIPDVYNYGIE